MDKGVNEDCADQCELLQLSVEAVKSMPLTDLLKALTTADDFNKLNLADTQTQTDIPANN